MNYGRKGLQSRRRKLSSHGDKLERAFGTNLLRILLFSLIFILVCSVSLGIGVFKGILASTPDVSEANIIPIGYATYMYDAEGNMIQKLTGSVDKLACGDIAGSADFGALHISSLRLHQQQLRGSTGQMPGKMGLVHQIHPPGAPKGGRHMTLLVGHFHQRNTQRIRQKLSVGITHHKAGHIAALHGSWAGT